MEIGGSHWGTVQVPTAGYTTIVFVPLPEPQPCARQIAEQWLGGCKGNSKLRAVVATSQYAYIIPRMQPFRIFRWLPIGHLDLLDLERLEDLVE